MGRGVTPRTTCSVAPQQKHDADMWGLSGKPLRFVEHPYAHVVRGATPSRDVLAPLFSSGDPSVPLKQTNRCF